MRLRNPDSPDRLEADPLELAQQEPDRLEPAQRQEPGLQEPARLPVPAVPAQLELRLEAAR